MKRSYSSSTKYGPTKPYIPRYKSYANSGGMSFANWKKSRVSESKVAIPPAVKRFVNRRIALNEEVKQQNVSVGGLYVQPYNTGTSATSWYLNNVFACTPYPGSSYTIAQGAGQGDRIGNKIRTKKLVMKYIFNPAAYNAVTNSAPAPMDIRMFWLYDKDGSETLPSQLDFTKFFQVGDASASPQSYIADMMLDVNRDLFQVYAERRYKLGYQQVSAAGVLANNEYYANNDYQYNVMDEIDLTPYTSRVFTFNDNNNSPNTKGLYCVVLCAAASGAILSTTQLPVNLFYTLQYKYTDA